MRLQVIQKYGNGVIGKTDKGLYLHQEGAVYSDQFKTISELIEALNGKQKTDIQPTKQRKSGRKKKSKQVVEQIEAQEEVEQETEQTS